MDYMKRITDIELPADWKDNSERLGLKDIEEININIHPSGIYSWPDCPLRKDKKEIFLIVSASGEHYKYTKT